MINCCEKPLVTIITPTYNRAEYLPETIESVLSQNYPNIEYIVLDDGSTDNTRDVIKKYSSQIVFESHPNIGETATVNKGLLMSKGDMVCVVNSDDPLLKNAIITSIDAFLENPNVLALYPDWIEIGPNSEIIEEKILIDYNIENMLNDFNVLIGPGVFIPRRTIEMYGFRDINFSYVGDLEYWFRLAVHGELLHIPKFLATHRTHPEGASNQARGKVMANELVEMVKKTFLQNSSHIPNLLKSQAFSQAHYAAYMVSGNDVIEKIYHMIMSFTSHPLRTPELSVLYLKLLWKWIKK